MGETALPPTFGDLLKKVTALEEKLEAAIVGGASAEYVKGLEAKIKALEEKILVAKTAVADEEVVQDQKKGGLWPWVE